MQENNGISRRNFLLQAAATSVLAFPTKTFSSKPKEINSIEALVGLSAPIYSQDLDENFIGGENKISPNYENSSGSSDSRRSVIHSFQKGDTVTELRFYYGDQRSTQEILGEIDPKRIPAGSEIEFLAERERFERHGLTPDPREYGNWDVISKMNGAEFFSMISDFSYRGDIRRHIRLIPGLVLGGIERNTETQIANLERLRGTIVDVSNLCGIDPLTHTAIAYHESRFRACTISTSGAMGPWQLMKETAARRDLGGEINPYNEEQAAERSARFLRRLYDICAGFPGLELVGYSAGDGAAEAIVKIARSFGLKDLNEILSSPLISLKKETIDYPKKIMEAKEKIAGHLRA